VSAAGQNVRHVGDVLRALHTDREGLSWDLARHICDAVDYYRQSSAGAAAIVDQCALQVDAILGQLDSGEESFDTSAARDNGSNRAMDRVPLTAMMEAYRTGLGYLWRVIAAACRDAGIASDELVAVADRLWQAQDLFTQAMSEGYTAAATEQLLLHEAERAAIVEAILQGATLGQKSMWTATDALGLPEHGSFVVAVAHVSDIGRHALPGVENRLRVADIHSAWRLRPDTQVGIVHIPTPAHIKRLVEVLNSYPDARQGISPIYAELDATGPALHLARTALAAAPATGGLIIFDDEPILVTSVAEPEVMRRIAATVLGPLATMGSADRQILLTTFHVWLRSHGSPDIAAQELFVHPNTVRQRLRRLESRTGRSLTDPRDLTALCIALEADQRLAELR
jgi:hypothetical protein